MAGCWVTARRRVPLVQPSIQPPGGGNSVAAWMIEGLKRDHDVTVCTLASVDLDAVNRFYGTAIGASEVRVVRVPSVLARLVEVIPLPLALLKAALLWRTAVRVAADYDVVISGNSEADFGRPGIQYIHYPWNLRPRPTVDLRWYHLRPILRAYYALCDTLAAFSPEGARLNLTLVNSDWTGALVTRRYGIATQTQARRRADLAARRELFSTRRFMDRVREIVARFPPAVRTSRGSRG